MEEKNEWNEEVEEYVCTIYELKCNSKKLTILCLMKCLFEVRVAHHISKYRHRYLSPEV